MREHKNFWDRNAGLYDCFMRKDRAVYEKMYELIRPVVKDKTVLEVATGTGLIAKHIVKAAAHIEATDASPEMIAEAKRGNYSAKLRFSVQDMFSLPYSSKSFDVVIVSNALHIVPQPEKSLREIKRVLKDDGVLIAPTFTHAENSFPGKIKAFFMNLGYQFSSLLTLFFVKCYLGSCCCLVYLKISTFCDCFTAIIRCDSKHTGFIRNGCYQLISCIYCKFLNCIFVHVLYPPIKLISSM